MFIRRTRKIGAEDLDKNMRNQHGIGLKKIDICFYRGTYRWSSKSEGFERNTGNIIQWIKIEFT